MKHWTKDEIDFLIKYYPEKGKKWCIEQLNKTEGAIRSKTSELKIKQDKKSEFFKDWQTRAAKSKIGKKRPEHAILMKKYKEQGRLTVITNPSEHQRKAISDNTKKWIKENGHPRGMLGKTHTDENKRKFSIRSKKMWADPKSKVNSEEHKQKQSDRMSKWQQSRTPNNNYSRTKRGVVNVNGREIFFRSSWDCNIAFYLEFLKLNNEIKEWEYEPDVFWFEKIKRGVRSYKPDFKITENDDSQYYIEVKGWMDAKSATKLKRMKIYYPSVRVDLIDEKRYKEIKAKSSFISGWGTLEKGIVIEFLKCEVSGCENKSFSKNLCRKHFYKIYKK